MAFGSYRRGNGGAGRYRASTRRAPARRTRRTSYAGRARNSAVSGPVVRLVFEQAPSSVVARPEAAGLIARRRGKASM